MAAPVSEFKIDKCSGDQMWATYRPCRGRVSIRIGISDVTQLDGNWRLKDELYRGLTYIHWLLLDGSASPMFNSLTDLFMIPWKCKKNFRFSVLSVMSGFQPKTWIQEKCHGVELRPRLIMEISLQNNFWGSMKMVIEEPPITTFHTDRIIIQLTRK